MTYAHGTRGRRRVGVVSIAWLERGGAVAQSAATAEDMPLALRHVVFLHLFGRQQLRPRFAVSDTKHALSLDLRVTTARFF